MQGCAEAVAIVPVTLHSDPITGGCLFIDAHAQPALWIVLEDLLDRIDRNCQNQYSMKSGTDLWRHECSLARLQRCKIDCGGQEVFTTREVRYVTRTRRTLLSSTKPKLAL